MTTSVTRRSARGGWLKGLRLVGELAAVTGAIDAAEL